MYSCPVCGFNGLLDDPFEQTFEICDICGVEFGNDDFATSHDVLYQAWAAAGKPIWDHEGPVQWLDDFFFRGDISEG